MSWTLRKDAMELHYEIKDQYISTKMIPSLLDFLFFFIFSIELFICIPQAKSNLLTLSQMEWNWYEHCWISMFHLYYYFAIRNEYSWICREDHQLLWMKIHANTTKYQIVCKLYYYRQCRTYRLHFPYHSIFFQMP